MVDSMLIIDWKVESICEFDYNKILVHLQWTDLLVIDNWEMIQRVTISGQFTMERSMLLPGFNFEDGFPFIVSYGKESFDLINIKTGCIDRLIMGTSHNIRGQTAVFFTNRGIGTFDMDFCITRLNKEGLYEQCWYKMRFNDDFVRILSEYGRLPISSITESMEIIRDNTELQERFDHLRKKDDAQK